MKLYFVRHGESEANLLHEFSNSGLRHPLTLTGVAQARALASTLAGLPVEHIYASPVMRAVQTAQILAESLHVLLEITEALREWSVGIYEGTTDPLGWQAHRQVQEDWFVHQQYEHKMPGGESFLEIRDRFVPFIEKLVGDGRSERSVVLVSHGGLYAAMLPHILKNVDYDLMKRLGFGYTCCLLAESGADGLRCVSWGGVPFENL